MASTVFFLIVFCLVNCTLCTTFEYNKNDVAQPIDYQIKIVTFLEKNSSYEGHVEILTTFSDAIDTIKLNKHDKIYIKRTQVFKKNERTDIWEHLQLIRHRTIPLNELYILEFKEKLFINKVYKIIIDFYGYLSNDTNGFFVVKNSDNRWASTNLRRYGAKRLFPCFDLPNRLTDFTLELAHDKSYNSTFITDEEYRSNCKDIQNYVCVKYKKVSFIAPYMLRFLIGSFRTEIVESVKFLIPKTVMNTTMQQLNDHTKYLQFIAHEIKFTLNVIEKYFEPKYLNIKILLLAEFQYSDSWGFITLQQYPVHNIGMAARKFKQKIRKQLRFQLARETFEQHFYPYRINPMCDGFAKLIEYTSVLLHREDGDDTFISSKIAKLFVTDVQDAMSQETLLIQNENIQIGTSWITMMNKFNFDDTKYNVVRQIMTIKRGAIFMMFENILTKHFLQSNFETFVNPDGFERLTTIARTEKLIPIHIGNIIQIFLTWDTVGFPLINLEPKKITQQRFRYDGINEFSNIDIPISYAVKLNYSVNESHTKWITSETEEIDTNDWLLVNLHSHGYYRVNYTESQWMYLTKKLLENSTIIESVQRTKLIDDAFQLARAGQIKYDIPLNLATYLINEISYGPWKATINNFIFIESLLETKSEFKLFTAYLKILLQNNNDIKQSFVSKTAHKNIQLLFDIICRFEVYDCVKDFDNYMLLPESQLQNIKLCTFYNSQLHNIEEYDNYWKRSIANATDLKLIAYHMEPLVCIIDYKYPHKNIERYRTYAKHFRESLEKAKPHQEIFLEATLKYQGRTIFGRLMILDIFRNYYSYVINNSKYFDDRPVQLLMDLLLRMTIDYEINMFDHIYHQFRHNFTDEQKIFLNKTKNTAKMNVQTLRGKKEAIIVWLKKYVELNPMYNKK